MPEQELSHRFQKAVLWERGYYDAYGQPTAKDPVEIDVRWEDNQSESLDQQGNTVVLDASVTVDRKIAPGSLMWLGSLADLPFGTDLGDETEKLMQVVTCNEVPDIKGRVTWREVGLKRYTDSLPGTSP